MEGQSFIITLAHDASNTFAQCILEVLEHNTKPHKCPFSV